MEMNMRLIGAASIDDLRPDMVDVSSARHHGAGPTDSLSETAYDKLITPYQMLKSKL
jgi:L-lactate dehydrogenase (cytochrome)